MGKLFQRLHLIAVLILIGEFTTADVASAQALPDKTLSVTRDALLEPLQASTTNNAQTRITSDALLDAHLTNNQPSTNWPQWQAQSETTPIQITDVRVEPTEADLQIILETDSGEAIAPAPTTLGNALVAEIPNAVLLLPDAEEFLEFEPAEGIALVQVRELSNNRVQVIVTGTDTAPMADVSVTDTQVTLSVAPGVAQAGEAEDPLRIVVTDEADEQGYRAPNATTGTRTDTPILEIPQAIQVIPSEVLEDQAITDLQDALRNVSGVSQGNTFGNTEDAFVIRGFDSATVLQNGFRAVDPSLRDTANLERIEVLQGPASVLYGSGQPGGVVNLVTEQPLSESFYELQLRVGSNSLIRPELDISGPLTDDDSVLYRLNAAYERGDGFRDFDQDIERVFLAPVLSLALTPQTDLTVEFEYLDDERPFDRGVVAIGDGVADLPSDRILGEPDDFFENDEYRLQSRLEHRFSDDWTLRTAFQYTASDELNLRAEPSMLNEATGDLSRIFISNDSTNEAFAVQTEIVGEFNTGSIEHTLLFGIDFSQETGEVTTSQGLAAPINIFDPEYEVIPRPDLSELVVGLTREVEQTRWGFYLQNQIDLTDNLILVLGGRVDLLEQDLEQVSPFLGDESVSGQESVFSPRVGLVYQPIETLSLYASYSRSFQPNAVFSITADGEFVDPERGTQYEIGIKADWFGGRLSSTLALYDLTRTNVAAPDPTAPPGSGFVIPIGEERSRGIGLDIAGEILPGWNIIASYAYIDAEVTDGNDLSTPEGNRVNNVPRNSASLWTTYEIPNGDLQGLGFGLGFFYVDNRVGDSANTFELPSYFRTDAAVFYRRNNWRVGLNIQNLFDVDYFESTGNSRLRVNPGAPLTIIGTVAIEF
ncbi:TonB-dependent siderophore receptor [Vacuolonema iberomarrocanum]|uniref:TonB-dependent siderophore receptor n=1 Tax=Vacuolonema iberomarrocanum TaxID=3454632 RepID=UPI001A096988|nr:TonB-dependent receptor [filamentous cyanobacterium LEGE 07170]